MSLKDILVRPLESFEESRYQTLMNEHHYLGSLPKIGESIRYAATLDGEWVALLSFSSAALKCSVRDQWIGWDFRHQYDRLHLVTNNSRFLILPDWHLPNLASRVLSLCHQRLPCDWQERFGHPLLLLETFVDPDRFQGTIYKAANWVFLGYTKGFQRVRNGYGKSPRNPKMTFILPLQRNAQRILSQPFLDETHSHGGSNMMLAAEQMHSLPDFFRSITDPRRSQGCRHRLSTILSIAAAATLCGARGYKAIADWAKNLGPKARERLGCRSKDKRRVVPSESAIRNLLVRVDPQELDNALRRWNEIHASQDETLAIDGKTMCNAIDGDGRQIHIMSVVGHRTRTCHTQKK